MSFVIEELFPGNTGDIVQVIDILNQLSSTDCHPRDAEFALVMRARSENKMYVARRESSGLILGTASLMIEQKLIHNCGRVGRIEDVVVAQKYRGQGIGRKLVEHCQQLAKELGCYKVLLQCDENKVAFYQNLGFQQHEVNMRWNP